MNDNGFLKTIVGQKILRRKRERRCIRILIEKHEPNSKNAMSKVEAFSFQYHLLEILIRKHRRAFRAPVIVEMTLHSTKPNPPELHNLAKNYLDLMMRPLRPSLSSRKALVFNDDRLVRLLIVRHHLALEEEPPWFAVVISPLRDYLEDISLLDHINNKDFEADYHSMSSLKNSMFETEEGWSDELVSSEESLREIVIDRERIIRANGQQTYNFLLEWEQRRYQEAFIKSRTLRLSQIMELFRPATGGKRDGIMVIRAIIRDMITSPLISIDLGPIPIRGGESKIFQSNIEQKLNEFKISFPALFPLRTPVGVTIIYLPPAKGDVDLDNLARRVIPWIHRIFKPPRTELSRTEFESISDLDLKEWVVKQIAILKRMPRYAVTQYQVISLPRLPDDPDTGFVRLFIDRGSNVPTIWERVQQPIEEWMNQL